MASANLAASYVYDSFGKLTASTGTVTNPFEYTGREFDPETGLYYYRARYYDPVMGRFLSEDPSGAASGLNLYRYVSNNPVNLYDPTGLREKKPRPQRPSANTVYYICCQGGKLKVCNQNGGAYSGWVSDCMRRHEQQHVSELTCGGKNPCNGQPDGPLGVSPMEKSKLECSAYQVELECLVPAPMTKEIQDRRRYVQEQIAAYCGGR
jgi:RHS repeat-associated protein